MDVKKRCGCCSCSIFVPPCFRVPGFPCIHVSCRFERTTTTLTGIGIQLLQEQLPGGVTLDQILVGGLPSNLQKHTVSVLYTNFRNVYPKLTPARNVNLTVYQVFKNGLFVRSLVQNRKLDTIHYTRNW